MYVVPDTALAWGKEATAGVVERRQAAGVAVPHLTVPCCNGFRDLRPGPSSGEGTGTSVAALWRSQFSTKQCTSCSGSGER